ncbi:hypothetical protein [Rubritalea marina]|uniref:hypothetical protein n=1 Tax=Rubritalea marina TaxID=361055 RepID=UPI00037147CF|nr:hypothetical protein [Rubritalea marina]
MKFTIFSITLLAAGLLFGQSGEPAVSSDALGGQSLGQAASDPTASLMNVQLGVWSTVNYHNLPNESSHTLNVRSAVPFQLGGTNHIMRVTVPVLLDGGLTSSGLSDITVFDLMVFDQSWGRWGLGPVALLPTGGETRGSENWGLGPAIGFTAKTDKLLAGLFNQNVFSVHREGARQAVNVSIIQPIVSYSLPKHWSLGASEMNITYDWENDRWKSLPIGVKLAKLLHFGEVPCQVNLQYEHDFADDELGAPEDIIRLTFKFLFPK